jgi:hypothetical protein
LAPGGVVAHTDVENGLAKEAFAVNIAIKSDRLAATKALASRVSVVTGSTSGIGLGIARARGGRIVPVDGSWTAH